MTGTETGTPTGPQTSANGKPRSRRVIVVLAALGGIAAGLAAVYGIGGFGRNPAAAAACTPAVTLAGKMAPFTKGEVAAVSVASDPRMVPDIAFTDATGATKRLADWRGKTVLLNLWATWCVPCRKEMPALDALQAKLGGSDFQVVAVNIDTRDPDKPKAWLDRVGIKHLTYYSDSSAKAFQELKAVGRAFGMPTTLLVDPKGCELGYLAGPAEWQSDDAVQLIKAALGK